MSEHASPRRVNRAFAAAFFGCLALGLGLAAVSWYQAPARYADINAVKLPPQPIAPTVAVAPAIVHPSR